ncbi:hypothetical protein [Sulfurovum sp.]|uniref:hypothetical protein n=1 Tax=Sulfurovum sp. TaxID=1969726 RepID=UPI003563AFFD
MKVTENDKTYMIKKGPSIFTNRNNASIKLDDVSIFESGKDHGVKFEGEEGRFCTIARIAAEDGDFIRSYSKLPNCINVDLLRQWGFVA